MENIKLKKVEKLTKNLIKRKIFHVSWRNPRDVEGIFTNGTVKVNDDIYFRFSCFTAAKDFTYYQNIGFYVKNEPIERLDNENFNKAYKTICEWKKSLPKVKAKIEKNEERFC